MLVHSCLPMLLSSCLLTLSSSQHSLPVLQLLAKLQLTVPTFPCIHRNRSSSNSDRRTVRMTRRPGVPPITCHRAIEPAWSLAGRRPAQLRMLPHG